MIDLEEIASKIKAGDEQAFEAMFKANYAGLCGYAQKYVSDLEQAEEIVQDVFCNFWNKRASLEVSGSLEAYLYRSVRNTCINHLKHLKVRNQYAIVQARFIQMEEKRVYDKMQELELHNKIEESINLLPTERQKIFKLSRFENMKYQEIAIHLGISIKTVEAQMGKALKFLRENLAEYLPILLLLGFNLWSHLKSILFI